MINLLKSALTQEELARTLASAARQPILPPLGDKTWRTLAANPLIAKWMAPLRSLAEKEIAEEMPVLTDELYREFFTTGKRSDFEGAYFERRRRLARAAMAALIDENNAGWIQSLRAKTAQILAEPSWALPAHVTAPSGKDPMHLDLFACETANTCGELLTLFGAVLPAELVAGIKQRLRKQIFENYIYRHQDLFWTKSPGNWNGVCHYGILGAALASEEDTQLVARLLFIAKRYLPVFLAGFGENGGCPDGPGSWQYGFGSFSFLNEQLEQRSGGALSLFADDEHVQHIACYGPRITLSSFHFVNFGDNLRDGALNPALLDYLGRRLDNPLLRAHAYRNFQRLEQTGLNLNGQRSDLPYLVRLLLRSPTGHDEERSIEAEDYYFKDLSVFVARARDQRGNLWEFATKGGNNAEPQNHNDCGSYLLNINGTPLVVEIGAPGYTKDFFSENRYDYLAARTLGHSLPIVNGHEQAAGLQHAAKVLSAELTADRAEFSVDLAPCYPAAAGCIDLVRSFYLDRRLGRLRVKEFYELATHESFETSIITDDEVVIDGEIARIKTNGLVAIVRPFEATVFVGTQAQEYRDHSGAPRKITRLIMKPSDLAAQRFVGYEIELAGR